MQFSFPLKSGSGSISGMKYLCDIQKASNGWVVTVSRNDDPSSDDLKSQIEGFGDLMKYIQQNATSYDEPWKQGYQNEETDVSSITQNLFRPPKPLYETHLFLEKAELLKFIDQLLGE